MTSMFFKAGPHEDPSALTAFAGCRIIRDSEHRDEETLEKAAAEPNARFFGFAGGKGIVKHERQVLDPYFARYELAEYSPDPESAILLGREPSGAPLISIKLGLDPEALPGHLKVLTTRAAYSESLLDRATLGAFALAVSLNAWTDNHAFCGRCGSPSKSAAGGFRRECTACGNMMFPRTDPVVIMLIVDEAGDRVLLGRSPHFPAGRYSCLAGFLEPGETIEDAVRRETQEESGIRVGAVRYHASQPWPMPHSLMLGCYGKAESFDILADDDELEDCRWFSRDELAAIVDGTHPDGINSPAEGAIAYRLVRDFLDWK